MVTLDVVEYSTEQFRDQQPLNIVFSLDKFERNFQR